MNLKRSHPNIIFSLEEANDRLVDIFKNHHFSHIGYSEIKKLAQFYQLLMLNQKNENFTRLVKFRDIAIKHFIDCLMVPQVLPNSLQLRFPLMDLGTGPGFPGIPLKILYPEQEIILAEGVQKRVVFLKKVRDELNLDKLSILGRYITPEVGYPVQSMITRAVEDISQTLINISSSLQKGGIVYFMKGPHVAPEILKAQKEHSDQFELVEDLHYDLPKTSHKRRLVAFCKLK